MSSNDVAVLHEPWMDCFSKNALRRGAEYARQGEVRDLNVAADHKHIDARVAGGEPEPHNVQVGIKVDGAGKAWVDALCSCPVKFNCKHAAAAVFAALEGIPNLFPSPPRNIVPLPSPAAGAPSPVSVKPRRDPVLPSELQQWITRLQRAAQPADTEPRLPEQIQTVIYLLRVEGRGRDLMLKATYQQVRRLKAGGYGMPQRYSVCNVLSPNRARFIQPVDVRIARLIESDSTARALYDVEHCLHGESGLEILKLMVETGRCHWIHAKGPPLTLGETRPAQPVWEATTAGLQVPGLTAVPPVTHLFPLRPPWYFDEAAATVGPLETGLPPALAEAWLAAPPLCAMTAGLLNDALHERLPDVALPAAQAAPVEELPALKPTPCLRLSTARFHWWELSMNYRQAGLEGLPVHLARLRFDYHGLRVDETDPRDVVEEFSVGKLLRVVRDRRSEEAFVSVLRRRGLVPTENAMPHCRDALATGAWALPKNDDDAWFKFCLDQLPNLREAGWIIEYADDFQFHLTEPSEWYVDLAPESANDWFGVELGVQVGGEKVNLLPVLINLLKTRAEEFTPAKLAKMSAKSVVPVPLGDGRVLPFPAARLRSILGTLIELHDPKALNKQGRLEMPKLRAAEVATLGENGEWRWFGSETLKELGRRLKNFKGIAKAVLPSGLQGTLRPYQHDGLSWLQFLREYNLSGILADDMGLGKTIQALAHIVAEKEAGRLDRPCLVVAPTSLMTNWRQETERFAPGLRVLVSHGGERKQHFEKLGDFDLIVTSYSLLSRDQEVLLGAEFHLVILDEAQYIKNPKTKFAQVACQLKARHQLCLTGTPMENHLGELWSLFNFLIPGFLGDEVRFRALFRNPIEKANNHDRRDVLARRVAPFILRRRKEQVASELPAKTEIVQNVEINGAQRDLYESIRLAMHAKVKAEIQSKGLNRSQIIILDALLKLRQVCCDPRLVPLDAAKLVRESAKRELVEGLLNGEHKEKLQLSAADLEVLFAPLK